MTFAISTATIIKRIADTSGQRSKSVFISAVAVIFPFSPAFPSTFSLELFSCYEGATREIGKLLPFLLFWQMPTPWANPYSRIPIV
jgi:hypothetical protein